jgi:hypothetical protein
MHERCLFLVVNGSKARTRYVICSCDCHYENPETVGFLVEQLGNWGVDAPNENTFATLSRYVDTINAIAAPKYEDSE